MQAQANFRAEVFREYHVNAAAAGGTAATPTWAASAGPGGTHGRGLHSSTFQLSVSTFCGIRWIDKVTKTAQVEPTIGRV